MTSIESTISRLWRHPNKSNGKTTGDSFAYCQADDVKYHDDDIEGHEVSCVYWRRVPVKIAFLGENTGIFSIGWVIKQLFHGCLAEQIKLLYSY